jgi:hypothetical protein
MGRPTHDCERHDGIRAGNVVRFTLGAGQEPSRHERTMNYGDGAWRERDVPETLGG